MWRYLKSAFLVSVDVPGLGRLPINALGTAAFAILGFAQPALWFVGLAIEAAVLPSLAFNPRFQKVVQAQDLQVSGRDVEQRRQALVKLLEAGAQQRLWNLGKKCNQVLDVYRSQQAEDYILDSSDQALKNLEWVYLKLLVARHHLLDPVNGETEQTLEKRIEQLDDDLRNGEETESLRQSKTATMNILKKRRAMMRRKRQTLEEIESDLTRIENQVDLILENATVQGKPQTIAADIELASDLLGGAIFGDDQVSITDLDQAYGRQKPKPQREPA